MAMIGIDLGTTNSLVSVYQNHKVELIPNALGNFTTKSAVSVLEDGTILVGDSAKERLISHPDRTAAYFKRFMGTEHEFVLGDNRWKAHELSAFLLRQLKQDAQNYLGEQVEEAVISVPAYFNDNQRNATKLAGRLAGLHVTRLINEPSAAALYYHTQSMNQESKVLVIDFGGGTLDVSVVDCFDHIVEIISIAGDNRLGGKDIDEAIVNHFCQVCSLSPDTIPASALASLYRRAEGIKISQHDKEILTCVPNQEEKREYRLELSKEDVAQICKPLFHRVEKAIASALKNSGLRPSEITEVVLVGGSSKQEVFISFLENLFGKKPYLAANPDEIVAMGVGLCSAIKSRLCKDVVMTDVCPFSLGIGTYNRTNTSRSYMSVLIERNSLLPISHTETFFTVHDNQTIIECRIYQGEGRYADENLKIGELSIQVPPGPGGKQYVQLTFTYDIDGILHVDAKGSGGNRQSTVICNPCLDLSKEELEQRLKAMEQIKWSGNGHEKERLLFSKLERLYCELTGDARVNAAQLLEDFERTMHKGSEIELIKKRAYLESVIRELEREADDYSLNMGEDGKEQYSKYLN